MDASFKKFWLVSGDSDEANDLLAASHRDLVSFLAWAIARCGNVPDIQDKPPSVSIVSRPGVDVSFDKVIFVRSALRRAVARYRRIAHMALNFKALAKRYTAQLRI